MVVPRNTGCSSWNGDSVRTPELLNLEGSRSEPFLAQIKHYDMPDPRLGITYAVPGCMLP
jgi:hypothetical protein